MSKDQEIILICFPFKDDDILTVGARDNCSDCGLVVWKSQSSIERIEKNFPKVDFVKNPLSVVCVKCFNVRAEKIERAGKEIEVVPPTPEQLIELRTIMNKNNPNVN
jgi:hypothetical protein